MPFNGAGTFDALSSPTFPAVAGELIYASQFNNNLDDIFTGLSTCVTRDGQSPWTHDLPAGNHKITGLSAGTAAGHSVAWGQTSMVKFSSLNLADGAAVGPSYSFTGDTNTGMYRSGPDSLSFAAGGGEGLRVAFGAAIQALISDAGTATNPALAFFNDTDLGFYRIGANQLGLSVGGVEAWRWDTAGRQISGETSARVTQVASTAVTPYLQLSGTSLGSASYGTFMWSATASSAGYALWARSRGAAVGTHTILQNGDAIGRLSFAGSDGTNFVEAARISIAVNGAPGVGAMPGALTISTTPVGGSVPLTAATFNADQSSDFTGSFRQGGTANVARFNGAVYGTLGVRQSGAYGGAGPSTSIDDLVVENSGSAGLSFLTPNTATVQIAFGDEDSNVVGRIRYAHATDLMDFFTGGAASFAITGDGRIYGTALHNNAGAVTGTTNQYIASGTYTPTGTNITNIFSTNIRTAQWIRVGNVAHVTGEFDFQALAGGNANTTLELSLPIASNLAGFVCAGAASVYESAAATTSGVYVTAGTANDRVRLTWTSSSTNGRTISYAYSYVVL